MPIWACQISIGVGAGNIGDELMTQEFWRQLPPDIALEIALFPESTRQHEPYPPRFRYRPVDWAGTDGELPAGRPGLLVGGTPVTDAEGVHWPMQFLSRRLQYFHDRHSPVDAVGVGVDRCLDFESRRLFEKHFLPIRSWTVRSSQCKLALIAHGVPDSSVRVGADLAWLYTPRQDLTNWAAAFWHRLDIDPSAPLLLVNVVNLGWHDRSNVKRSLAAALDWMSERMAMQIAFFCNECRPGLMFDYAAALEVVAFMRRPAVVVPNKYYSPAEAIALLACATVTFGQRYHFVVESVLAGSVPVGLLRGEKMHNMTADVPIPAINIAETLDNEEVVVTLERALQQRADLLSRLALARLELAARALDNLSFLRTLSPYTAAAW